MKVFDTEIKKLGENCTFYATVQCYIQLYICT